MPEGDIVYLAAKRMTVALRSLSRPLSLCRVVPDERPLLPMSMPSVQA